MAELKNSHNNPSLFREMSKPFESNAAADVAYQAFYDELGELRKKHKITNLYVVINAAYVSDEGEEQEFFVTGMFGSQQMAEALAAYGFGQEQAKRQELIDQVLNQSLRRARKRLK